MPEVSLLPVADGAVSTWNVSPVGPAYLAVMDFAGADGDTSFTSSGGNGKTFTVITQAALPHRAEAVGYVGVVATVRRSNIGGSGAVAPRVDIGAVQYEGPAVVLTNVYQDIGGYGQAGWWLEQDPETNDDWTIDRAISCQIGLVDRSSGLHTVRCTTLRKVLMLRYASDRVTRGPNRWWPV